VGAVPLGRPDHAALGVRLSAVSSAELVLGVDALDVALLVKVAARRRYPFG
jgi:hypothetical protein